jgi:hypothetical protein
MNVDVTLANIVETLLKVARSWVSVGGWEYARRINENTIEAVDPQGKLYRITVVEVKELDK